MRGDQLAIFIFAAKLRNRIYRLLPIILVVAQFGCVMRLSYEGGVEISNLSKLKSDNQAQGKPKII